MERLGITTLPLALVVLLAASASPQSTREKPAPTQSGDLVSKIDQIPGISPTATLAATSVVSGLLVYLVTRHLPSLERRHRKELAEAQDKYSATLDLICKRYEARDERQTSALGKVADSLAGLQQFCAGRNTTNPSDRGRNGNA